MKASCKRIVVTLGAILSANAWGDPVGRTITSVVGYDQPASQQLVDTWIGEVRSLYIDDHDNMYYLDLPYNVIRRVDGRTHEVRTIIGNGKVSWNENFGPDDEGKPALEARLGNPATAGGDAIAVDRRGILYIADAWNFRVRAVNLNPPGTPAVDVCTVWIEPGTIRTIAGNGEFEGGVDGVPALETGISFLFGLEVDRDGSVYYSEPDGGRVRRIDARNGTVTTVAGGGGRCAIGADNGDGGPATEANICGPSSLAMDAQRRYLYIAQWNWPYASSQVRRVDLARGTISTIAGNGLDTSGGDGGPAPLAGLAERPGSMTFDEDGNLFICDGSNSQIRRVDARTHIITTVAGILGHDTFYNAGENGLPATQVTLNLPETIFYKSGRLYIGSLLNANIRMVVPGRDRRITGEPDELIYEIAGHAGLKQPFMLTVDADDNLFVMDNALRLMKVDHRGALTPILNGRSIAGSTGDGGPAIDATSGLPVPFFDDAGTLYALDFFNGILRRILPVGGEILPTSTIEHIADMGSWALGAVVVGRVAYIAQAFGTKIWTVDLDTGVRSLFAGGDEYGYGGDGGPAALATFTGIAGLTYDRKRDALYVSDIDSATIRKIDLASPEQTITAVAKLPTGCPPEDWWCGAAAGVQALAAEDFLFVINWGNRAVYRIDLAAATPTATRVAGFVSQDAPRGFTGDHVAATETLLSDLGGLAVDSNGKIYITEAGPQRIRRLGIVDIMPGQAPNVISLGEGGELEVAVLATYDPSFKIDASTLSVGAAPVILNDHGQPDISYADVDDDGRADLIFRVRVGDLDLTTADREAAVIGQTVDGQAFADGDWVTITP